MRLKINSFYIYISFPSIALISIMILSNFMTSYFLCLIAIIIHETGHLLFMVLLKCYPAGIEIKSFNIKIIKKFRYKEKYYKDILITLAGPVFNILSFSVFLNFNSKLSYINLFVGLFNLLPAASLDGGQLIYLFLRKRFSAEISTKITDIITIITAFPVCLSGIMILFSSKYNFSLLFIGLYLFLSVFIREEKYL